MPDSIEPQHSEASPPGSRWTFYDAWEAFPLSQIHAKDSERGEIMIALEAEGGGTHGEFAITWYDLGGRSVPQLKVFSDGWDALRLSEVVELLAPYAGQDLSVPEVMDLLRVHGFKDRTSELRRRGGPIICPTCDGKGYSFPKPNATLVTAAAPDLLAACKDMREILLGITPMRAGVDLATSAAYAAILKAEGRQS